tara:strand:+ start:6781 stop:7437 length:657 start_codon:yes stop_codon:yes gene_type:complete
MKEISNNISSIGIVGMGRTGTTLLREILKSLFVQNERDPNDIKSKHWYEDGDETMAHLLIMCRRDLRDSMASSFRDCHTYDNKNFNIQTMINPYPKNFKIYKEHYGVPKEEILKLGNKLMNEGWNKWKPYVHYIFHYEAYMENPQKIIQEIVDFFNFKNPVSISKAIKSAEDWLKEHPKHSSPSKGKSNSWYDIFSQTQEEVILDNFKDWMLEYNYIK